MSSGPARQKRVCLKNGQMFILSAPSGTGKTTLCRALLKRFPTLAYSVSYTTRSPRPGEKNGVDYYFISHLEFEQGIANDRWAEFATVHGHYYGTSAEWIKKTLAAGTNILLDIDTQGARQITSRFPDTVTIFILPPSMEELAHRLEHRGTEKAADFNMRLTNAVAEMALKDSYRHQVVNDNLDIAIEQLADIVSYYL